MTKQHAHAETDSNKKHGDKLAATNASGTERGHASGKPANAEKVEKKGPQLVTGGRRIETVPIPENGSHEKSHAAHLGHAHEHTKPEGAMRHGKGQEELREPPMVAQRMGKQHR